MAQPISTGELFVGVDGGGTKTALCVVSSAGDVLSHLVVGSTNPNSVSDAVASATLQAALQEAATLAGGNLDAIRGVVLSISGCNSSADSARMESWLRPMFPTAINAATAATSTVAAAADATPPPVLVSAYNDSIAALVSGTSGELDGLVVIAGTGMISKGFRGGREVTAGGNGALIDSGSGYAIGLDILRSAFAAADGMGPATPLLQATMCFLQIERPEQMVDWLYADRSWERVARLAPLAFAYAAPPAADTDAPSDGMPPLPTSEEEADPTARAILDTAAAYLVRSLAAVAKQLDLQTDTDITIVCAGGLLANPLLFSRVSDGVHAFLPRARLVHPCVSPSEGAAMLARKQWQARQTNAMQE